MSIDSNNTQELYDKATAFDSVWEVLEMLGFECGDTNKKRDLIQDIITGKAESHMILRHDLHVAVCTALWMLVDQEGAYPMSERFAKATAAVRDLVDLRDTKLYCVQEGMEHRIIWKDAAGEEHEIYKNTEH